ncbi:hypothetical protein K458DRAFT_112727 [Lentithecium fluviatile CBS 122367]|uniref:Mid2 domain-containing protein n=1 Tax=Lentithecium fluviatile CBS 122367 TaxID=1168545 RepID=A0A6G1INV3_9PLEO|nr:hypothetical protein K458DRAFT_112727 [Lentithecium fluviatile CBS 122367]
MASKLPITLLSAVAWAMLAHAAPADPTITAPAVLPRQLDSFFIGYLEINGTWYSQDCDVGLTWYQDGDYGQCCPETVTSCPAPTACVQGSQIYPLESTTTTIACTENYNNTAATICNTAFIYASFGDPNPKTDIVCGDESVNWSYYRKVPSTATEIKSASSTTAPSPGLIITTTPSPTAPAEKSKSKAWIAGAVVGPVVGIALIAGLAFFLIRRRKNKKNLPQTGTASMGPPPGVTDAKPQMVANPSYGQPQSPGFNPNDPYNQQGYAPTSPAPQYSQPNAIPGQGEYAGAYAPDNKQPYNAPPSNPQAAELGGSSSGGLAPSQVHAAELDGENPR